MAASFKKKHLCFPKAVEVAGDGPFCRLQFDSICSKNANPMKVDGAPNPAVEEKWEEFKVENAAREATAEEVRALMHDDAKVAAVNSRMYVTRTMLERTNKKFDYARTEWIVLHAAQNAPQELPPAEDEGAETDDDPYHFPEMGDLEGLQGLEGLEDLEDPQEDADMAAEMHAIAGDLFAGPEGLAALAALQELVDEPFADDPFQGPAGQALLDFADPQPEQRRRRRRNRDPQPEQRRRRTQ